MLEKRLNSNQVQGDAANVKRRMSQKSELTSRIFSVRTSISPRNDTNKLVRRRVKKRPTRVPLDS